MAHYRKVDTGFHNDARVRALSDDGKLLFLCILTHPNLTSLGAMRATRAGLAEERGWPLAKFDRAFGSITEAAMVAHDASAAFLWVRNFLRYNPPDNPNVVKGWRQAFNLLPECDLREAMLLAAHRHCADKGKELLQAFSKTFGDVMAGGEPSPQPSPEPLGEPLPEPSPKGQPNRDLGARSSDLTARTDDPDDRDDRGRSGAPPTGTPSSVVPWTDSLTRGQLQTAVVELLELWRQHGPEGAEKPVLERLQPQTKRELADALRLKSLDEWEAIFEKCKASDYLAGRTLDEPRPVSLFRAIKLADKIEAGEYRNFDDVAVGGIAPGWTPPTYRLPPSAEEPAKQAASDRTRYTPPTDDARRALAAVAPNYVPPDVRRREVS